MSQMWLDKLRDAPNKVERDVILLRDFQTGRSTVHNKEKTRCYDETEDQLRALADLAFPKSK